MTLWRLAGWPAFDRVLGFGEYAVLFLMSLGLLLIVGYQFREFKLRRYQWLLLVALLLLTPVLNSALVLTLPHSDLPIPPYAARETVAPNLPLLGLFPILLAAATLGSAPAAVLGLLAGFFRAAATTQNLLDIFQLAYLGALAGYLLRQDYRGSLPALLRRPSAAGPLAGLLSLCLLLVSTYVHGGGGGLVLIDYAWAVLIVNVGAILLEGLIAGLLLEVLYLLLRSMRPVVHARRVPPYSRTLNRQVLFLIVPLIMLFTAVLVYAVTTTAVHAATEQAVEEMARNAVNAAESIPYFTQTGQSLLQAFADNPALVTTSGLSITAVLEQNLHSVLFFEQLAYYDRDGQLLGMYPEPEFGGDGQLTGDESELLDWVLGSGAPQMTSIHSSGRGEHVISFLTAVGGEQPIGALVGRTRPEFNPVLVPAMRGIQWTMNQGEGFIVDDTSGLIVAHPNSAMVLTAWSPDLVRAPVVEVAGGRAYEAPTATGRQLIYYLPLQTHAWSVVIQFPQEVVLRLATRIATPLLGLLLLLGTTQGIAVMIVATRATRPLEALVAAAGRIAEGNLSNATPVQGGNEVGRLAIAFEGMRLRLKARLDDLSLLLQVSQAVSATLELTRGVPYVLEGALKATRAAVARIVLLSAGGAPQVVMARGEPREGLAAVDRSIAASVKGSHQPLIIENLNRARTLIDTNSVGGRLKAIIALPIGTQEQLLAVMWLGYVEPHPFEAAEVDLLSTLAGQTAVLVENARLFQAAEGGRRQLAAILSSTSDAVLVVDREDRVLLINPAAERTFGVRADHVIGVRIEETALHAVLDDLLTERPGRDEVQTREIPAPGGRTLYANVSPIIDAGGQRIGQVVVLRDVTHFKELDEMKSEFVATVSHDLRAPLTFVRGYATMIPMVGQVNERQQEYVEKILMGIEQMGTLIDDLLNLGRIEAGIGLEREYCHPGAILMEAAEGLRGRATSKGQTLRLVPAQNVPVIYGDPALLRQAVANLIDNAIKYTPAGGTISVGLNVENEEVVMYVRDTGIGIAPADQARLFEKFYRVKRRDTIDIPGTGLGLAIVRSIVERHGGCVRVKSTLDEGSTFFILLPVIAASGSAAAPNPRRADLHAGR